MNIIGNIVRRSFEQSLLELLAHGNIPQYHIEVNRPFRFPYKEQECLQDFARLETHGYLSQTGEYLPQGLGIVSYTLRTELEDTEQSRLRIIEASFILKNAAWHNGSHLDEVVSHSGRILEGEYPLTARDNVASALKNAAYYSGHHIGDAVKLALRHGIAATPGVRGGCVRTILHASKHYRDLLQTEEVRELLERRSKDENSVISGWANEAYVAIFG